MEQKHSMNSGPNNYDMRKQVFYQQQTFYPIPNNHSNYSSWDVSCTLFKDKKWRAIYEGVPSVNV